MADKDRKEPMIGAESRPTAVDYTTPISDWKVQDLMTFVGTQVAGHLEQLKYTPIPEQKPEYIKPEHLKPEHLKPEHLKPEHVKPEHWKPEHWKPELMKPELIKGEALKVEKEIFKERLKPELSKPEKEIDPRVIEQVAQRTVELLKQQGLVR